MRSYWSASYGVFRGPGRDQLTIAASEVGPWRGPADNGDSRGRERDGPGDQDLGHLGRRRVVTHVHHASHLRLSLGEYAKQLPGVGVVQPRVDDHLWLSAQSLVHVLPGLPGPRRLGAEHEIGGNLALGQPRAG